MTVPIVRLTIDHMRHEIAQALTPFFMQQDVDAQEAVNAALRSFNVRHEIQKIAEGEIRRIVQQMVATALVGLQFDPEFRNLFKRHMLEAIKKETEKE